MNKLTIFLLLIFTSVFGQEKMNELNISGNLKVYFGTELQISIDAMIELLPTREITTNDSLGNYKFSGLKSGTYILRVLDYSLKPKEYNLTLETESIINFDLVVDAKCEFDKESALSDLKKEKAKLLLIGGIAPVLYNYQSESEKKYGFEYYDFGCTPPAMECVIQYNKTIFDFFDKEYGLEWRNEVREDVIGLN